MAYENSVAGLLAGVRQDAYLPATGGPSDADLCNLLSRQNLSYVVPVLMSVGDEFFVKVLDFDTVSGTKLYDIPADSIASKVRDVLGQFPNATPTIYLPLEHTEPEREAAYATTGATYPSAYYIQGNQIAVLPSPTGVWPMKLKYYARPSRIVPATAASTISSVSGPSGGLYTVTVASTAGMATGDFDVLDPDTFAPGIEDIAGTVATSTTVTFAAAGLTAAEIVLLLAATGDTLCGAGTAPGVTVPPEAAVLLTTRTAALILQEVNDPRAPFAFAECNRAKQVILDLFAPRASGLPRRIVNQWAPGWGRRNHPWRGD